MKFRLFPTLAAVFVLAASFPARADFKVWTPDVNQGEFAIENVGDLGFDPMRDRSHELSQTLEFEYGLTRWWQTELEFEFNRDAGKGNRTHFDQLTLENLFQFTERGEYWLDAGFFWEYGHAMLKGNPDETTFGPVLRKDFWGTSNSINLFISKDIGTNASGRPSFQYAWETRFDFAQVNFGRSYVTPGFQIYGEPGQIGHFPKFNMQDTRGGPQLFGKIFDIGPGALNWNGGVLFGMTSAAPQVTLRWQAEYEVHF